jgi:hypothetical protein
MTEYLRLELDLEPSEPGLRPAPRDDPRVWWGPLIRRVFGRSLIDIGCPMRRPVCEDRAAGADPCGLTARCAYGVLFAESLTRRPPFALYVPPTEPGSLPDEIEVTLLGPAMSHSVHVIVALTRAVDRGLGQARRRASILAVKRVGERTAELVAPTSTE